MKNTLFILLVGLMTMSVSAQDFDHLMTKKQIDCSDVSLNSSLLFVQYINDNKTDSASNLLQYWESKCGLREPIFRAKILLAIQTGQFNDSLLSKGSLNNIFNYQNRMDMMKTANHYHYDNYKPYYGYIQLGGPFDIYTKILAENLKEKQDPESIEYLLTEFYSDNSDTILSKIQSKNYEESSLAKEYNETVAYYTKMYEVHLSWITGVWIPTGALKQVGVHPELGFQTGFKHRKMNYDMTMTLKFLNSPNAFEARRPDSGGIVELTNHFFGGHIGLDIGRDIWTYKAHELQLTGGIAFDGFDVLKEDTNNNLKSATVSSYNFNIGTGYRYYLNDKLYLGLRVKYNVVDYTMNNVIDFTGNPITIQFIVGGVNNTIRNENLKALKYKLRR